MKKEIPVQLLKQMLRIRLTEERIAAEYPHQQMRTPVHLSVGQEAVAVGVCSLLRPQDGLFCSHRCHAGYLAKGGDLPALCAELYGRRTGSNQGRAGSAHLGAPAVTMYAGSILAGMIPVAVGAAFAAVLDRADTVSVALFGDAALEEGVFSESVNFAALKKLPVLFVCENNQYSTHTPLRLRQPATPLYQRVLGWGVRSRQVDGNDVLAVRSAAQRALRALRHGNGPYFLECPTYRIREHVGPDYDVQNPHRTKDELDSWMQRCPIKRLREHLLKNGVLDQERYDLMVQSIAAEVSAAIRFAQESPWPDPATLLEGVE